MAETGNGHSLSSSARAAWPPRFILPMPCPFAIADLLLLRLLPLAPQRLHTGRPDLAKAQPACPSSTAFADAEQMAFATNVEAAAGNRGSGADRFAQCVACQKPIARLGGKHVN